MIAGRSTRLGLILLLVMIAAIAVMPLAGVGDLQAGENNTLQLAPVNPDFLEFRAEPPGLFFGYTPPPMDLSHLDSIPVQSIAKADALLDRFDWRDLGKVTSVRNQADCGTCWAFGVLSALESRVLINEGETYTPGDAGYHYSVQNLVCCTDPAWVYLHNDRCWAGGWGWLAGDTLTKGGARLEACQPYNTATIMEEGCEDSCDPIKMVTAYRTVAYEATSPEAIQSIKQALYQHGPLTAAYHHHHAYLYGDIYYRPDCGQPANHLVSIVGWDDDIAHPAGGGSGAWIVKNSWGTGWADGGYFYLCYGSANMQEADYLDYRDYDPAEMIYYWDEAGMVTGVGYESPTAWMANIFTSSQDGRLTHVDFYTTSHNAEYEIYVYLDGDIDELENLAAFQTGTCQEFGYYSIPLDSPVALTVGQAFTLVVKMTTPGYGYPIPAEARVEDRVHPPIQSGVSYIRLGVANPWADLESFGWNACLRARVRTETELTVITGHLPDGQVGMPYAATLEAEGGLPPYAWAWTAEEEGQELPPGLDLTVETGVISGTPLAAGTFEFTVQVTDVTEDTATADLSVTIEPGIVAEIVGETREVNCDILPGVTVRAYLNGVEVDSAISDGDGNYVLEVAEFGDYQVVASRGGFIAESQAVSVTGPTTTVNFISGYGLIPEAPGTSHVLACISLWKTGDPPCHLTSSRVLAVISVWKNPILED